MFCINFVWNVATKFFLLFLGWLIGCQMYTSPQPRIEKLSSSRAAQQISRTVLSFSWLVNMWDKSQRINTFMETWAASLFRCFTKLFEMTRLMKTSIVTLLVSLILFVIIGCNTTNSGMHLVSNYIYAKMLRIILQMWVFSVITPPPWRTNRNFSFV